MHREGGFPGTAPATVVGQSGRAADLVAWAAEAYNDIQRERNGGWRWLRRPFTVNVIANTASYAYGACTDVKTGLAITRFREWDLDDREPPLIYLVADGKATEKELCVSTWPDFRYQFVRGTHTPAYPYQVTEDQDGKLYVGPTPDATYTVTGSYWAANQTLALDADIPEMPADFHMLIPYRGLVKYGYNSVSAQVLARCQADGAPIFETLCSKQSWAKYSLSTAGPLA